MALPLDVATRALVEALRILEASGRTSTTLYASELQEVKAALATAAATEYARMYVRVQELQRSLSGLSGSLAVAEVLARVDAILKNAPAPEHPEDVRRVPRRTPVCGETVGVVKGGAVAPFARTERNGWICMPCSVVNPTGTTICSDCHRAYSEYIVDPAPTYRELEERVLATQLDDPAVKAALARAGIDPATVESIEMDGSDIAQGRAANGAGDGPIDVFDVTSTQRDEGGFLSPSGFPVSPELRAEFLRTLEEGRRTTPLVLDATDASPLPQEKIKLDDGKVDWTFLPFDALEEVVKVLEWAASGKYARESWRYLRDDPRKGTVDGRALRSALRHIVADTNFNQPIDPETGLSHLAHAACQVLFAIAHRRMKKEKQS